MRYQYYFLFFLTSLCCSFSNCGKEKACEKKYHFEFPVTLSPAEDTFLIGDTIWILMEYNPDNLYDLNGNDSLIAGDFDFGVEFLIGRLNDSLGTEGINEFTYKVIKGELLRIDLVGVSIYKFQLAESGNKNFIHFGLIPQSSGDFYFEFSSPVGLLGEIEFVDINCKEFIELSFDTNNGASNNYDFYINNVPKPYSDISVEDYKKAGIYSFSIME